jgi:hypothetical protein
MGIQIAAIADGHVRVQLADGEVYDLPEGKLQFPPSRTGGDVRVSVKS